jgi:uncharacterized membrane protein
VKGIASWFWRRGWSSREALGGVTSSIVFALAFFAMWLFDTNNGSKLIVALFAALVSTVMFSISRRLRSIELANQETDQGD